jgi:hypothetical protein
MYYLEWENFFPWILSQLNSLDERFKRFTSKLWPGFYVMSYKISRTSVEYLRWRKIRTEKSCMRTSSHILFIFYYFSKTKANIGPNDPWKKLYPHQESALLEIPEIIVLNHFEEIYILLICRLICSINEGLIMHFLLELNYLLFKSRDGSVGIATG